MKTVNILIIIVTLLFTSCYYDNAEEVYQNYPQDCDVSAVTYSNDVSAIIDNQCLSCHKNPGAEANLDLSEYNSVFGKAPTIKYLINLPASHSEVMPPGGMPNCDVKKITAWIDNGAPNN